MAEAINTRIVESKTTVTPEERATFSVQNYYDSLKKQEAAPADPNELILIGIITPEDSEYQKLILSGSTPQEIESRSIIDFFFNIICDPIDSIIIKNGRAMTARLAA